MTNENSARPGLRKLAKNRRFEEMEAACLEDIEAGAVDREELVSALTLASHRAEPETLDTLVWVSVTSWSEAHGAEAGIEVARDLAPLVPDGGLLRDEVVALYSEAYREAPAIDAMVRRLLEESEGPFADSIAHMDALLRLPPGTCFRDRQGKVIGRAIEFDEGRTVLVAEVDGENRTVTPAEATALYPLEPDDFRAMRVFETERLRELAEEDSARLCEMVLHAHGPKLTYRELRSYLADVVPGAFPTWWNAARPVVSRSVWIDISSTAQPTLTLRRVPLAHDVRVRREIADAATPFERLGVVLDYLGQAGEHVEAEGDLLGGLAATISADARNGSPAEAWCGAAVLAELGAHGSDPLDLPDPGDPLEFFAPVTDPRLEIRAMALLRDRLPEDWAGIIAAGIPACTPDACEEGARILEEGGHTDLLPGVMESVLKNASRFGPALVWLWKEAGKGGRLERTENVDRVLLLCRLIQAIDRGWKLPPAERHLSNRLRSALTARNAETARAVLSSTDLENARMVNDTLIRCIEFSDDFRAKVSDILVETHPKLFAKDIAPWDREDVIFSSREGLERKRKELDHLVTTVLPEIADAIGRAAAEGDLSENAEYTANLEKRERMTERANSLQADLARAKVLYPEMVGDRVVTVGSRIRVRDPETGEERQFSFLGPWDVDFDAGVYSYRAPLGQSFMGRRVEDVVQVETDRESRRWEILEIGSAVTA